VFSRHFQELRNGGRVSASYFDVRYYPGIGTIHFFPTSKKLIDRLNRIVGNHRRWLPPTESNASPAFWKQYDQAEKFDKAFHAELRKHTRRPDRCLPFDPFWAMRHGGEDEKHKANAMLINAMTNVLENNGINPDLLLEDCQESCFLSDQSCAESELLALE